MATFRNNTTGEGLDAPSDVLNKLSAALAQISRGDPIVAIRNEIDTKLAAVSTRFDAIDKATALQHEDQVRVPTQIQTAIASLKDLVDARLLALENRVDRLTKALDDRPIVLEHELAHIRETIASLKEVTSERFKGVAEQFAGRDTALQSTLLAQKTSVEETNRSNSLAAQKAETAFQKQLEAINELFTTQQRASDEKTNDLRDRITKLESTKVGSSSAADTGFRVIAAIGVIVAVLIAVGSVIVDVALK